MIKADAYTLGVVSRISKAQLAELRTREAKLMSSSKPSILSRSSASYSHFRNSRTFNAADLHQVMNIAGRALEIAIATRAFRDRQSLSNEELELGMLQDDLTLTPLGDTCAPKIFCDSVPERYRRIDGACNNIRHPAWGSHLTPYARLLPPSYKDGVWSPRVSEYDGAPLASPRKISTTLFKDENIYQSGHTLLVMQFGQYMAHEITQSIDNSFMNGSAVACCQPDGSAALDPNFRHDACMPIIIPEDDPFYGMFQQRCMNFVRSLLAPRHDCTMGYAEQMNKVSHFIDASSVYGSTPDQTGQLRSFEGGKLITFDDFGRDLLPITKDSEACLTMEQGSACFNSGDTRTNQMITLAVLHTIFMREHNRLASELQRLNPSWSDERLFLEARQILIAEIQVVVYKEFLPAVIGEQAMKEFNLNLKRGREYSYEYDPSIEPSVTNEFTTAAFRFGHSIVDGQLKVYGTKKMEEIIFIPEVMFHPSRMRKRHFFDQILSTLTTEPIQEVDDCFSDALTRYMFRAGNPFGIDLAALNIQRGRDHGIRPYNDYRELVGLSRYTSFNDFGPKGEALRKVYASVDDVDLWVGGLFEEKPEGSMVGYVFRDIIADQFVRLKNGDKYFFENDPSLNPGHFTPDQLEELRKVSMSRIICDNSDGILLARQAINAFRIPGVAGNDVVDCSSELIPRINLFYWKENHI
ncbi:hypothetical protein WA026_004121 [Henosepilachna vigintioctopunctata]|uniref:Chorion peroxidase n=1 Tax=Henosepilachna vigintioctopunctata TaxID=420089 RepID=A0AAW1UET3_9CUCU